MNAIPCPKPAFHTHKATLLRTAPLHREQVVEANRARPRRAALLNSIPGCLASPLLHHHHHQITHTSHARHTYTMHRRPRTPQRHDGQGGSRELCIEAAGGSQSKLGADSGKKGGRESGGKGQGEGKDERRVCRE